MGTPVGHKPKGGKKNRKWYRNRVGRSSSSTTSHYRLRHGIPVGSRQENHAKGICPAHRQKAN